MKSKFALSCADCGSRNYSIDRSKEAQTKRLELKKFCKRCNAHTPHKETK